MATEVCQLCEVVEINERAFNKLDAIAQDNELVICRHCYNGRMHEALFFKRAETKTALLVSITWIRGE